MQPAVNTLQKIHAQFDRYYLTILAYKFNGANFVIYISMLYNLTLTVGL